MLGVISNVETDLRRKSYNLFEPTTQQGCLLPLSALNPAIPVGHNSSGTTSTIQAVLEDGGSCGLLFAK